MTRRGSQQGFTLIEVIVVVTLVALVLGGVALGFKAVSGTKLQSSAWTLASATRYAYSRAVNQGVTVRLVLDFEKRTMYLQETAGRVVLNRDDETGSGLSREGVRDLYDADGGVVETSMSAGESYVVPGGGTGGGLLGMMGMGSMDNSTTGDPMADMMGNIGMGQITDPFLASMQNPGQGGSSASVGNPGGYRGPRFGPVPGERGEHRDLEGDVKFLRVYTPHEPKPREDGRAYVYFFPGGMTEHSVILLSDGDEDEPKVFSLEVHPLSGKATIHSFEWEPEEELDELQEAEE